jgi:branched-chain amino acid aminotransferase group I
MSGARHLINLWAAPRTSSTSLMYSFAQRPDTAVVDEPLYAAYLARHPAVQRAYRAELLRAQPSDVSGVVAALLSKPGAGQPPLLFAKHIAKQAAFDDAAFGALLREARANVLLIREPRRVLASWFATMGACDLHESAFDALEQLLPLADAVVQQEDLVRRPEGTLRALCAKLDVPFHAAMLRWPRGGRPEDGLWAKHWYHSTHAQTGFDEGVAPPLRQFPPQLAPVLAQCEPIYARLRAAALAPAPVLPDARNADIVVWVGDGLVPRADARVSVFDSAVQGGDAVWEGLRVTNGRIFALDEHLDRLFASAHALAFERVPSRQRVCDAIGATLRANAMRDGAHIRLTLTRGVKVSSGMSPTMNQSGPTLIVLAEHKRAVDSAGRPQSAAAGTVLVTASQRRNAPHFLDSRIHHNNLLNNILAKIEANNAGADDALMLDAHGFVAETNATNIFIVDRHGRLLTPLATACLPGITRNAVLERVAPRAGVAAALEAQLSLVQLYTAAECFTTGTMGGIVPVVQIDGRQIGDGQRGPVTARLQEVYAQMVQNEGTPFF